jgi:hypothetical protein
MRRPTVSFSLTGSGECKPDCQGKPCGGSDGCGQACDGPCAAGLTCVVGSLKLADGCYACSPLSCPKGCCTPAGTCVVNDEHTKNLDHRHTCGYGGKACKDCGSSACYGDSCTQCGNHCQVGECSLDGCGKLCPNPECGPNNICQKVDDHAQCALPPTCGPLTCSGCCFGSYCEPGNTDGACGSDGATCKLCTCGPSGECQGCAPACSEPYSCGQQDGCGGRCVGAKGNCFGPMICTEKGQCVCPVPSDQYCGATCIDVLSDSTNCGKCGHSCPSFALCQNGQCHCPAGQVYCEDPLSGCFNLATDTAHCGACAQPCSPGSACQNGICVAP